MQFDQLLPHSLVAQPCSCCCDYWPGGLLNLSRGAENIIVCISLPPSSGQHRQLAILAISPQLFWLVQIRLTSLWSLSSQTLPRIILDHTDPIVWYDMFYTPTHQSFDSSGTLGQKDRSSSIWGAKPKSRSLSASSKTKCRQASKEILGTGGFNLGHQIWQLLGAWISLVRLEHE